MILADVVAEEIDAGGMDILVRRGRGRSQGCGCQSIEMGTPEHIRFTDYAGGYCNGGDGGVEFGMGGGEEEGFEVGAGWEDGV